MDQDQAPQAQSDLRQLVADVAAAYFRNSRLGAEQISTVIEEIATSLAHVGLPAAAAPAEQQAADRPKLTRAQIRRSVTPDAIISFENGKPYKALRRHLVRLGQTPAEYRAKWGLAADYPMVAASFSEAKSQIAKTLGLGQRMQEAKAKKSAAVRRGRRARPPAPESAA